MLDTSIGWIGYHLMGYMASGEIPGRMGAALGMVAPYEGFATTDGHLIILGGNDGIFARLCEAFDLPDAADDERFKSNASRVAHRDELHERCPRLALIRPRRITIRVPQSPTSATA